MVTDILKIILPLAVLYLSRFVGLDPCTLIPSAKDAHAAADTVYVKALDTTHTLTPHSPPPHGFEVLDSVQKQ